jgi:hypothetical protein
MSVFLMLCLLVQNFGNMVESLNKAMGAGAELEDAFEKLGSIWPTLCLGFEGMLASQHAVDASLGEISRYIAEAEDRATREARDAAAGEAARARREEQERLRTEMVGLRDRLDQDKLQREHAERLLKDREGELAGRCPTPFFFVSFVAFSVLGGLRKLLWLLPACDREIAELRAAHWRLGVSNAHLTEENETLQESESQLLATLVGKRAAVVFPATDLSRLC